MQFACAIRSSVAYPAIQYFSTLSHKEHEFGKKNKFIKHKVLVFISSTTEKFHIRREMERDLIKNVYRSSYEFPVILVRF